MRGQRTGTGFLSSSVPVGVAPGPPQTPSPPATASFAPLLEVEGAAQRWGVGRASRLAGPHHASHSMHLWSACCFQSPMQMLGHGRTGKWLGGGRVLRRPRSHPLGAPASQPGPGRPQPCRQPYPSWCNFYSSLLSCSPPVSLQSSSPGPGPSRPENQLPGQRQDPQGLV